ncbi:MAG: oxidoreductase, partial [Cyclobacteriaceae bacterium]|nr:oxidoreductase [Cyclobacteriaceae bacterium]
SRKALSLPAKAEVLLTEYKTLQLNIDKLQADDVFCCLGTTIRKAKTKEAFKEVDYDYPLALARLTLEKGAKHFLLVSALGASARSSVFYNKVKGEIEQAIASLGFESFSILRPSLLLGERSEQRAGEDAAKLFYKIFGLLIPKKYKGIEARQVAKAMLLIANNGKSGKRIFESDEIQDF